MACSECKKKEKIKELQTSTEFVSKGVIIFAVVWSLLALYGLYSIIKLFL